jgi:uncharacterized protein YggE
MFVSMKTFLSIVFALTPGLLLADGGLPDKPFIYVKGSAETQKQPDLVKLRFALIGRGPDRAKANADVQTRASKLFDMLSKRNIGKDDIIAEDLRTETEFEESETGRRTTQKVIGYSVHRDFHVKVRDVNTFPKLIDDLIATVNAEFEGYNSIESAYSKEKELEKRLWEEAVANARADADRTLKNTGMKVDSIFAISPVGISEISSGMFPTGGSGSEAERVIVTGSNIPTAEERLPSEYRLTPISIKQVVHVIYLISPTK